MTRNQVFAIVVAVLVVGGGVVSQLLEQGDRSPGRIQILAPQAREKVIQGEPYAIRWRGGDENETLCISIYPHPEGKIDFQECGVPNTGEYLLDTRVLHLSDPKLGVLKDEFSLDISGSEPVVFEVARSEAALSWAIYRNEQYGLEFQYPGRLSMASETKSDMSDFSLWVNLRPPGQEESGVSVALMSVKEWKALNESSRSFFEKYEKMYASRSLKDFASNIRYHNTQYFETTDALKRGVIYFERSPQAASVSMTITAEVMDVKGNFIKVQRDINSSGKIEALNRVWIPMLTNPNTPRETLEKFRQKEEVGYFESSIAWKDFEAERKELEGILNSLQVKKEGTVSLFIKNDPTHAALREMLGALRISV